jgi:hypothetical protein
MVSRSGARCSTVPDIDQGAIVHDMVELGRALVFFGMDTSGQGVAWTVDSSSLK